MILSLDEFKRKYYYSQATPMLQQYLDIKYQHQNCLVLFRVGDFYELFFDDAIATSKILGIALARKGKHAGEDLPMCGVPYHALESYLPRLVENGHKVAICEQFETPEEAKKRGGYKAVVQRKVVRIITSGTITEDTIIQSCAPNYLASLIIEKDIASIAYCDVSTAEFMIVDVELHSLCSELARINPREILLSEAIQQNTQIINLLSDYQQCIVYQVASYFSCSKARRIIHDYYGITTINSIGTLSNVQISVIGAILEYLNITLKDSKSKLPLPQIISHKNLMLIDASARKSLELVTTLNGGVKGSLFSIIDATVTHQGSRMLHKFVATPLAEVNAINYRLEMTDFFFNNMDFAINLRKVIQSVPDIERSLGRILIGKYTPKDLENIKIALEVSITIKEEFTGMLGLNIPQTINEIYYPLSGDDELYNLLDSALLSDLPNNISEGGFIKSNYHPKIHELRNLVGNSASLLEKLKQKYRRETSIETLKISHNNICGLFVEVNSKHVQKITDPKFIHKQTTVNAVRFITNELQSLDAEMQNAKTIILALEQEILTELCQAICIKSQIIANVAKSISLIDVFCNFACIAHENNYCRPIVTDDLSFNVELGRHPIVEQALIRKHENFVANDCNLQDKQKIWLITGPNMAGKSTFLRQNALIAILAQIGSYVPANSAHIGVVDKLFSRIGAADDLASGQSTFMVEMVETSVILAQSTAKSLVILDEIGRGTSTYDGISIAWSCLEYIHNHIKCRCLFATHYHELVNISQELQSLQNFTTAINDKEDKLSFLYKIITGAANKSYGINVAELAGLPKLVLSRARDILNILESKTQDCQKIDTYSDHAANIASGTTIYCNTYPTRTMEMIKHIDPDQLTPKEALEIVYKIKEISLLEN